MYRPVRGVVRNFSRGVKFFLSFPGDAQHPLGPENPLKLKDFTGHGEGLVPIAPPLTTPLRPVCSMILVLRLSRDAPCAL